MPVTDLQHSRWRLRIANIPAGGEGSRTFQLAGRDLEHSRWLVCRRRAAHALSRIYAPVAHTPHARRYLRPVLLRTELGDLPNDQILTALTALTALTSPTPAARPQVEGVDEAQGVRDTACLYTCLYTCLYRCLRTCLCARQYTCPYTAPRGRSRCL